jgi:ArsR family transcriptional regulator
MSKDKRLQEDIDRQASVFGALADPTRLKLVRLLCNQHEPDALCVNALAAHLGVTQSAVSQHLRVLRAIGLVKGERRGYHIHYFVNHDMLNECLKLTAAAFSVTESSERKHCQQDCSNKKKKQLS